MLKSFTCIICPNSCEIEAEIQSDKIIKAIGNNCPKGIEYIKNEIKNPMRNFSTSILVTDGDFPLCSVRLTKPVPKNKMSDVLSEIKKHTLTAPVSIGQTVISNVLDLEADVIATREIKCVK